MDPKKIALLLISPLENVLLQSARVLQDYDEYLWVEGEC